MSRAAPAYPTRPTIVEVALSANVAVGTVSRVLNTPEMVGREIRQRVLDAIARMNYTPLRRRRRNFALGDPATARLRGNFGLLLLGIDETLGSLALVSEALHGVEMAMSPGGMNLMLANVPKADRVPAFLSENQVDGLIIESPLIGDFSTCVNAALANAVSCLPHVWLLGRPESAAGDLCGADFDAGARLALEHLRARGHRRVVDFNPLPGLIHEERIRGALQMQAGRLGIHVTRLEKPSAVPVRWPLPMELDDVAVEELVGRWEKIAAPQRPTAFVVGSDSVAVSLHQSLRKRGWVVGEDVSVISLNHERTLPIGLGPSLTSLDLRVEVIGRRAVEQLLWRVRNQGAGVATRILIEPRLIEGASVAQNRIPV